MGFNSWNQFQCNINEQLFVEIIDALKSSGLQQKGYQYVNLDDCWQASTRDPATNQLRSDPIRFPKGIKFLADYAHQNGFKLGIYSDVGEFTCQHFPGSFKHFEIDANTFASWGIDYLKLDTCHLREDESEHPYIYYGQMSKALNSTGRPIVFEICNWGKHEPHKWAPAIAHIWRTTEDIYPQYHRMLTILDAQTNLYQYSGPYAFNHPDMIEVGVEGTIFNWKDFPKCRLSQTESKSHFFLWSMLNAPLILGVDVRNLQPWVMEIIGNEEVIAINQDELVQQARLIKEYRHGKVGKICALLHGCVHTQVWAKQLSGHRMAVLFFNRAGNLNEQETTYNKNQTISITMQELNLSPTATYQVRDVGQHVFLQSISHSFTTPPLPQHDSMLLILQ